MYYWKNPTRELHGYPSHLLSLLLSYLFGYSVFPTVIDFCHAVSLAVSKIWNIQYWLEQKILLSGIKYILHGPGRSRAQVTCECSRIQKFKSAQTSRLYLKETYYIVVPNMNGMLGLTRVRLQIGFVHMVRHKSIEMLEKLESSGDTRFHFEINNLYLV